MYRFLVFITFIANVLVIKELIRGRLPVYLTFNVIMFLAQVSRATVSLKCAGA